MKWFLSFAVVFIFSANVFAQNSDKEWVEIGSQKNELVFSVPSDYLVDNEEKDVQILGYLGNVSFRVKIEPTGDAKSRVKSMREFQWHKDSKLSAFTKDEFIGNVYSSETAKNLGFSIYIASSNHLYTIIANSTVGNKEILEKFLFSVKLNGKPFFKQTSEAAGKTENIIPAASLKTSREVLDAVKQKDAERTKTEYEPISAEIEDNPAITRPVFVLRKPRASYTDAARQKNVSGTIGLKVQLLANGQVGSVKVVQKLESGLDGEAAAAAKKIKFLPAQINGKNVDAEKYVEYTFTIY